MTDRLIEADTSLAHFVMVRHGQTDWNAAGRWQGWLDSPLTATGLMQAREASQRLKEYHFAGAYSSDAGRAIETARIIAEPHGIKVQVALELRERFYGGYEGLNSEEIDLRFPGTRYLAGRDTRDDWRPPEGETLVEVKKRTHEFLIRLARQYAGQLVLLVSHSGVLRVCDSLASGLPLEQIWERQPGNGAILEFTCSPAGIMTITRHFWEQKPVAGG